MSRRHGTPLDGCYRFFLALFAQINGQKYFNCFLRANMESLISKAKFYCCSLLPEPWSNLCEDEIVVHPITTGRSNRLFVCTRPTYSSSLLSRSTVLPTSLPSSTTSSDDDSDCLSNSCSESCDDRYSKVIVRFYGSELTGEGNRYKCVTDEEEIAILETLSSRGMAPSVLASFPGGRIDEFIESNVLPPNQLTQNELFKLISIRIAQYHSLPFKCERTYDLFAIYRDLSGKAIQMMENLDETCFSKLPESSVLLLNKIKSFLESGPDSFLIQKMTQIHNKIVFTHMDLNYTNFLITKSSSSNRPLDVMIIDVENSQNNFRGIDLGKFFTELCLNEESKDLVFISDSLFDSFTDSYLTEWMSSAEPHKIDPRVDNRDHLLTEIKLGFLYNVIFIVFWNVLHPNFPGNFLENTSSRIDLFNHFKQRWSPLN
uniref:ethanolamine kinase n=2 Tax=Tetranychus urticae TaxID=32264 RepID=T1K865_TETUR